MIYWEKYIKVKLIKDINYEGDCLKKQSLLYYKKFWNKTIFVWILILEEILKNFKKISNMKKDIKVVYF